MFLFEDIATQMVDNSEMNETADLEATQAVMDGTTGDGDDPDLEATQAATIHSGKNNQVQRLLIQKQSLKIETR